MNTRNVIKATIAVLSFAGGLALLGGLAHYAGAKSVQAPSSVVTIPEVTITGELSPASIIMLPEQVISASPSRKVASKAHGKATSGRIVRSHELRQGGSPSATSVVYWDSNL